MIKKNRFTGNGVYVHFIHNSLVFLLFREVVKKKSILNSTVLVAIWEPAIKYRSAYNHPVSESKLELKLSPTAGFRIIFVVVDSTKYTSNFLSQNNRKRGISLRRWNMKNTAIVSNPGSASASAFTASVITLLMVEGRWCTVEHCEAIAHDKGPEERDS